MKINDIDFDVPFQIGTAGDVELRLDINGPERVVHDDAHDILIDDALAGDSGWTPLTGYTGQYRYRGAVMHASEYIGGGLERDILATPGVYVVVAVEVDDDPEHPAGWAVLRRNDPS